MLIRRLIVSIGFGWAVRVIPPFVADKVGNLNIMMPSTILCGVILLAWPSIHSLGQLVAAAVFLASSVVQHKL